LVTWPHGLQFLLAVFQAAFAVIDHPLGVIEI